MPPVSKKAKTFIPPGFLFENDPRPPQGYFRSILHSHQYMPGEKRPATPEWNKARVEVNLNVIFEAIWHFSDFLDAESFWDRLVKSLRYHENTRGPHVQRMVEVYCEGRKEYLQKQQLDESSLAPCESRLLELVDLVNGLRGQTTRAQRPLTDWDLLKGGWEERLQVVLDELGCLVDDSGQTSNIPVEEQRNTNGKRPLSGNDSSGNGNGNGAGPSDADKEKTLFFFDLNGSSGSSGTASGSVPKRPALETRVLGAADHEKMTRIDKLDARLHVVEEFAAHLGARSQDQNADMAKVESGLQAVQNGLSQCVTSRDHEISLQARQKAVQEEMNKRFEGQTREATAQWDAIQVQLQAMQDQLKEHEDAITNHARASTITAALSLPVPPVPPVDSTGRDLPGMLAYQPKDFIEAISGELSKLRAITKSKIHQMDKEGLPDDENKLAVSDLSWQIGKCIKVAEKGANGLA